MQHNRSNFLRLALSVVVVAIGCSAADAQGGPEPIWPTQQWQTSTPEAQGMDSAALVKLLDLGTIRSFDSLLLVRHGRIVLEVYYAPYTAEIPHVINSSTKAVIGTLAAIAHKEGLLDNFDHPMLDFFAGRGVANIDDRKKAITLQHLMDMTSGIDWTEPLDGQLTSVYEMERSPDWVKFILDRPMSNAPGDIFNYNSGNPHLLSAILTKLTGISASDYAKAKLFGPLGISVWNWRRDRQGVSTGGYGLAMLTRDMAKIGYLYLRGGQWEGKALVPPAWIEKASHATINMNARFEPELRYSNFFWALPNQHVYMAVGYHCQVIMVFPELDVVAAMTARNFCSFGRLANDISGAVKSETALPANPAGADLLANKIRDISTEKPTETGAVPELAAAISGKTYQFPRSGLTVKSLSLTFTSPQPRYALEIYRRDPALPLLRFSGPIGLDGLYRKGEPTVFGVVAAKGNWLDGHTFATQFLTLGLGEEVQKWTLSFDGEKLNLRGKDRDGHDVSIDSESGG